MFGVRPTAQWSFTGVAAVGIFITNAPARESEAVLLDESNKQAGAAVSQSKQKSRGGRTRKKKDGHQEERDVAPRWGRRPLSLIAALKRLACRRVAVAGCDWRHAGTLCNLLADTPAGPHSHTQPMGMASHPVQFIRCSDYGSEWRACAGPLRKLARRRNAGESVGSK